MAERKTGGRTQSKGQTESGTAANTKIDVKATTRAKPDSKAKADTKSKSDTKAASSHTRNKNESTSRGSTASNATERWKSAPAEDQKFLKKVGDKLSASTKRAKWIGSTEEHQDRKGQSLATRNHDVIRRWAEERQAEPATVPNTAHGEQLGVLRFNFPGYGGDNLLPVSWSEWFKTFDERQLVFLYQENLKNGNQSNFFRFDNPFRENA